MGGGEPALRALSLRAPAKLNFGLRVVGRRSDGYHELESLFVPIGLADDVRVELRKAPGVRVRLTLEGEARDVPADATNLATRAARAFLEAAQIGAEVAVVLRKHVPAAAGLGGGSSDAGAVLRGLTRLFPAALPRAELSAAALRLGADVPFFVADPPRAAWVTGIGECVEPVEKFPDLGILLVHPGLPLATKAVFEAYDSAPCALTPPGSGSRIRSLSGLRDLVERIGAGLLANDLESAATRLCPAIARLKDELCACETLGVGMSGSGPTLFALFTDRASAEEACGRLALKAPAWARVTSRFEPSVSDEGADGASPNW
ncbi:MAG TPA: 4-(cytidine 5'-diphospho)-2-C-methyl-D-erythritol kinase [Myxococcota bacterium]|nr:4-(cytidine 5'-diphospho)-2-C-methyl-D-erythritol kinase [Myxococcota bacterium]